MATVCERCGSPIGGLGGLLRRRLCGRCQREVEKERQRTTAEYRAELERALTSPLPVPDLAAQLSPLRSALSAHEARNLELEAFEAYLEQALRDDILSAQEEERLNAIMEFLGIDQTTFQQKFGEYIPRLLVARINDGRLPEIPPERASVILKKSEVVHIEAPATLLKERTVRRGSYAGFSFRLARGVYFHTGQFRSAPQVERALEQVDSGTLSVTSQRVVFRGQRQAIEAPYKRLLGVDFYRDGLRLDISGRSSSPLFRLKHEHVLPIGACINVAAQRHLQE